MTRHSSSNGKGNAEPAVPPDGAPQQMEVTISKTIIQPSKLTTAEKDEEGRLHLSFVTVEGGMAVENTFIVEEPGQKNIMDTMTGGIEIASLTDIPAAAAKKD